MKGTGVTKIRGKHDELYTYIFTREWSEHWPASIVIEQGGNCLGLIDDVVLIESEEHAKKIIKAIRKYAAQLGWEV